MLQPTLNYATQVISVPLIYVPFCIIFQDDDELCEGSGDYGSGDYSDDIPTDIKGSKILYHFFMALFNTI